MDIKLTVEQINDMKHAVGFRQDKVKRGKYIAWRNYFASYGIIAGWEELIKLGLAEKRLVEKMNYYRVTEKGLNYLADLLSIKIVESD